MTDARARNIVEKAKQRNARREKNRELVAKQDSDRKAVEDRMIQTNRINSIIDRLEKIINSENWQNKAFRAEKPKYIELLQQSVSSYSSYPPSQKLDKLKGYAGIAATALSASRSSKKSFFSCFSCLFKKPFQDQPAQGCYKAVVEINNLICNLKYSNNVNDLRQRLDAATAILNELEKPTPVVQKKEDKRYLGANRSYTGLGGRF